MFAGRESGYVALKFKRRNGVACTGNFERETVVVIHLPIYTYIYKEFTKRGSQNYLTQRYYCCYSAPILCLL